MIRRAGVLVPSLLSLWDRSLRRGHGSGGLAPQGRGPGSGLALQAQPSNAHLGCRSRAQLFCPAPSCRQEDLALIKTGETRALPGLRVVAAPHCPQGAL